MLQVNERVVGHGGRIAGCSRDADTEADRRVRDADRLGRARTGGDVARDRATDPLTDPASEERLDVDRAVLQELQRNANQLRRVGVCLELALAERDVLLGDLGVLVEDRTFVGGVVVGRPQQVGARRRGEDVDDAEQAAIRLHRLNEAVGELVGHGVAAGGVSDRRQRAGVDLAEAALQDRLLIGGQSADATAQHRVERLAVLAGLRVDIVPLGRSDGLGRGGDGVEARVPLLDLDLLAQLLDVVKGALPGLILLSREVVAVSFRAGADVLRLAPRVGALVQEGLEACGHGDLLRSWVAQVSREGVGLWLTSAAVSSGEQVVPQRMTSRGLCRREIASLGGLSRRRVPAAPGGGVCGARGAHFGAHRAETGVGLLVCREGHGGHFPQLHFKQATDVDGDRLAVRGFDVLLGPLVAQDAEAEAHPGDALRFEVADEVGDIGQALVEVGLSPQADAVRRQAQVTGRDAGDDQAGVVIDEKARVALLQGLGECPAVDLLIPTPRRGIADRGARVEDRGVTVEGLRTTGSGADLEVR